MTTLTKRFSDKSGGVSLLIHLAVIISVILAGSVLVYGINTQISRTLFYSLVVVYFFTIRDKPLAISLLFILILNPWGLFYYRPHDWFLSLTSTVGISYRTIFILALVAKALYYKEFTKPKMRNLLKNHYYPIFFYLIFLISLGLVFGHDARSLYDLFTNLPVWLVFIVIPVAMSGSELARFNKLIILFTIVHVIIGIFDIITGGTITTILIFGREASTAALWGEGFVRLTGGIGIVLYSMVISLYYLTLKKKKLNIWYLWVSVLLSLLYIINSGTRGWIIAISVIMLIWLIYYSRAVLVRRGVVLTFVIVLMLGYIVSPPGVKRNINQAYLRLTTVEAIAEGDFTAGGTARRWDVRGPYTLTHFRESPVFGHGYSRITSEYYDGHVGNHSLLLMGGVAGFLIIWLTVLSVGFKLYRLERAGDERRGLFVFAIALVGIMVIHSTSRAMISFLMPSDVAFIVSLFFNQINVHAAGATSEKRLRRVQHTFK